jgi:hypothetical protein
MRRGRIPTDIPRILIDQGGSQYDIRRPQNDESDGRQTNDIGEYVGDSPDNMTVLENQLLYFHNRHMSLRQEEGGERQIEVIESSSYPDTDVQEDDRVTHDGIEWECQTVEEKPHEHNPSFIRCEWQIRQ